MRRVFFLLLILPLTPLSAWAFSGGIFGRARTGCGGEILACHNPDPRPTTRVCIAGLPSDGTYAPGTPYALTAFVDGLGVPPLGAALGGAVAGFNLEVTAGTLAQASASDPTTQLSCDPTDPSCVPRQLAHTTAGKNQNHWDFVWTAPGSGSVTVFLAGNAVNAIGSNDPGDLWNRTSVSLGPGAGEGAGQGIACMPPIPLPQLLPLPPALAPLAAH